MKVFEFLYTSCVYESAAATISIHLSKKGAWDAMKKHKLEQHNKWRVRSNNYRKSFKWNFAQGWFIEESEIFP